MTRDDPELAVVVETAVLHAQGLEECGPQIVWESLPARLLDDGSSKIEAGVVVSDLASRLEP